MTKGDTFEHEFLIDEKIYNGFISLFNDHNPLHTDTAFAKNKGFSDVVMHGNILGGFLSYFIGECLPDKNVIIHTQEIKYYNPVYLNHPLYFTANISDIVDSVKVVMFGFLFKNQHGLIIAKGKIQIGLI
jgi:3-hydroxybutyryl-CoA dehydratase